MGIKGLCELDVLRRSDHSVTRCFSLELKSVIERASINAVVLLSG